VSEKRVLRRIFGPRRNEVIGECRKLYKAELNDLYSSPNIVRLIKSRRRCEGHVACMGRGEVQSGLWWGNLRERDHLRDQGLDGRKILSRIFRKWNVEEWTQSIWLRMGTGWLALVNAVMNRRVQ